MPMYEFACGSCGTKFERLIRKEPAAEDVVCPECGGAHVSRELTLPAAPVSTQATLPSACGVGPPCGAPWCQRQG